MIMIVKKNAYAGGSFCMDGIIYISIKNVSEISRKGDYYDEFKIKCKLERGKCTEHRV